MDISMDKKYTLNSQVFTVLTVTAPGDYPVVGYTPTGELYRLPINGVRIFGGVCLVEISPYADFVIDEPVMVRDGDECDWQRKHFAGFDPKSGKPTASYLTAWTREKGKANYWLQCRRPTAEELAT